MSVDSAVRYVGTTVNDDARYRRFAAAKDERLDLGWVAKDPIALST